MNASHLPVLLVAALVMHVPLAVALVVGVALILVPEEPHAGARRAR